jgi:hypothetical protein
MIVKENHFQFDRKSLFNFWKAICDFENCKSFSGFKLFILARTFVRIRHRRALEFVGSLDFGDITEIQRHPGTVARF